MSFTDLFRSRSALAKRRDEIENDERDDASDEDDDIQTFKSKPRPKKTKTEKTRISKKKSAVVVQTEQKAAAPEKEVVEIEDDEYRAPEFLTHIEYHAERNEAAKVAMQKLRDVQQKLSSLQKSASSNQGSYGESSGSIAPEAKEISLQIIPKDAEIAPKKFLVKMFKHDKFVKLMEQLRERKGLQHEHQFLLDGAMEIDLQKSPLDYYLDDREEITLSKVKKSAPKQVSISPPPSPPPVSIPVAPKPKLAAFVAPEVVDLGDEDEEQAEEDVQLPVVKPVVEEEEEKVKVRVNYHSQKHGFMIKKSDPLSKLILAACKHFKKTPLKLKFDGQTVAEDETAESLGLEDDDLLDAY